MWKKNRDTAAEAPDPIQDAGEGMAGRAKSVAGSAAKKVKHVAEGAGQAAKTAGRATAGGAKTAGRATVEGAKTALNKTGSGLKVTGEVAGKGARRAGGGIKNVAGSAAAGAVTVGGAVAGTATGLGAKAWDAVDDRVESCWTVVKETFVETAGSAIQAAVQDDVKMERIFKAAYSALPADMRRWVSEEQFIGFCLKNRTRLVGAALQTPAKPEVRALPEQNDTRIVDV